MVVTTKSNGLCLLGLALCLSWGCERAAPAPVQAQAAPSALSAWTLTDPLPGLRFQAPVDLQNHGTELLYVVEQAGVIKVFQNQAGVKKADTFLDIRDRVSSGGERGLLGLAFDSDYAKNGRFYVNYTAKPDGHTVIAAFARQGPAGSRQADPASQEILLEVEQPWGNHNGGQLRVGPDKMLYIAVGDGGSGGDPRNYAQDRSSLLGSILRIDPKQKQEGRGYAIPADNPFVGNTQGWRPEIWAWGMRNPWRISFDRATGRLWAGDVGQNQHEEVDIIQRGGNHGWRLREGTACFQPDKNCDPGGETVLPVHTYDHSQGQSITGGVVYRGKRHKQLEGAYLFADFASGALWALRVDKDGKKTQHERLLKEPVHISSFGEDAQGEVYLCDLRGQIWGLAPRP